MVVVAAAVMLGGGQRDEVMLPVLASQCHCESNIVWFWRLV
jgi:hypothetical protein